MVRHGDLLLRPIPEPKKVLAAAEVAAFTLATSEATHTLTGRIEPATVEVSDGTAIPVVHVLEPSSLIHEEHPSGQLNRAGTRSCTSTPEVSLVVCRYEVRRRSAEAIGQA